jgi:hypothetical protein
MKPYLAAALTLVILLAGCQSGTDAEGADVLAGDEGTQVVAATTQCTSPNADGQRCDRKTCVEDDESNCKGFAEACLDSGHHYEGTSGAGICTRVRDF